MALEAVFGDQRFDAFGEVLLGRLLSPREVRGGHDQQDSWSEFHRCS